MTRIAGGDVVRVAPTNNIYTALVAAGFAVALAATILFFLKANEVLGAHLFE